MGALSYGWQDRAKEETFWIRFNACTRPSLPWKEELYTAARALANGTQKHVWVCASGGYDSEAACHAFFDQGLNFSVLTLEHAGGTNQYETERAKRWCRARDVEQHVVRFDVEEFFGHEIDAYTEAFRAVHPFRYVQLKLLETVESLGGVAVMGSDDHLFRAPRTAEIRKEDLYLSFSNQWTLPYEWMRDRGTVHEASFHLASPELSRAYLDAPVVRFALEHPDLVFRNAHSVHTLKALHYQSVWPDMEPRRVSDGFDSVRTRFRETKARLEARFGDSLVERRITLPEIEQQLTPASV